jgi:DNA-binding transcriptional MerR regulator
MLTIGQLAAYAGVTTRAVRHYHQIGLLPEPDRDASGYRTYTAPDVVRLIRVRTLAGAGVPLARVQTLLDATAEEFSTAVAEIDDRLRSEIRDLQEHRRRIAKLAAGDNLALPVEVTDYLDRMRAIGVPELLVEMERDSWILIAAQLPEKISDYMVEKVATLDDPLLRRLYQALGALLADDTDDEVWLGAAADALAELTEKAAANGELDRPDELLDDRTFIDLLDNIALAGGPRVARLQGRLQELMIERGWKGWVKVERAESPSA